MHYIFSLLCYSITHNSHALLPPFNSRPACFIFFLLLLLGSIGATSALAQTSPTAALPRTLTGKVTTIAGAPLAGATVLVRGDQRDNTAITNKEGMFLLTTRQAQPVLIVNCAGYEENQADVPQTRRCCRIASSHRQVQAPVA